MDDVHDLSVDIIEFLESEETTVPLAVAALVLSAGRLMNPREGALEVEEEIKFVQGMMEFATMFFADGTVN